MHTAGISVSRSTRGGIVLSALLSFVVVLLVGTALAQTPEPRPVVTVRDLAVEGNRRVQASAILAKIQTKIGDPFSPVILRDDQKSIFALGYFDDVQVRTEEFEGGVRVVFAVVERPILREVSFEGNNEIKTDDLRGLAKIRVGVLYNPEDVRRAEEAIRDKYEDDGYLGVQISPRTERTPEGDLRVIFRIEEGKKTYIDRITIEGNQALTTKQIKAAMETKERFLWIIPFSRLHRKVFDDDADRILNLYGDNGYIQARIESQNVAPDLVRGKVDLRIRVVEGAQFRTGTVTIKGNQVLPTAEIRKLIKLKEGAVFNRGEVRDAIRAITDRYSEIGRARAEVNLETDNDLEKRLVNVTFLITEGSEVYVERINITGNTKSSEKILRRELRLAEGDLFSYQNLVRSRQRLFNLGYFEEVNVQTRDGSAPDKIIVDIEVKERSTGLFSIGAGYGSVDGIFATLDVTQRNLFGRGYEAFVRVRFGTKSQLGLIGFTDPYFLDLPIRAGFDFYDQQRDYDDFTENRLGGDVRASYPLAEYMSISSAYRLENVKISNVPDSASDSLKEQIGTTLNSVIDVALARDTRDNIFEPTRGNRNAIAFAFAGLGGDAQYYKIIADSAWFYPLPAFDWILGVRGLAGYAAGWGGQDVPIFERFFLGGSTSLRGYRTRSVAPQDRQGDVIGGDTELLFTTELIIPIFPRFRLAVFFDAGNAYGFGVPFDPTNLLMDVGAGVRFNSPLGPLRLDYGFALNRRANDKVGQLNFTVGAPF